MIPFNKPYLTGKEFVFIQSIISKGKTSGNGEFTKLCQSFFEKRYNTEKVLLTTSCTDALEMAAMLANISPGDEVILPSYTFVSTALAFVRQGAKLVWADSYSTHPCMDADQISELITPKTRVIVVVHYGGVACEMDTVMHLAKEHNIFVVEDAAHSIDATYKGKQLGTIGDVGCFSFHETKNIQCGEGGMIFLNKKSLAERSEILWEKGTDRAKFYRGEVDKYGWVDVGSSFLPNEMTAAFLWGQLQDIDKIQHQRIKIWERYNQAFQPIKDKVTLPLLPDYASNNAHLFYLICNSLEERTALISFLKEKEVSAPFHYLSLHKSKFMVEHSVKEMNLPESDRYTNCLVRLPLFVDLKDEQQDKIIDLVLKFYSSKQ